MVVVRARQRSVVGHAHLGLQLPQGDALGARARGDEPAVHLLLLLGGGGLARVEVLLDVRHGLLPPLEAARSELALLDRHLDEGVQLDAVRVRLLTAGRLKERISPLVKLRSWAHAGTRLV